MQQGEKGGKNQQLATIKTHILHRNEHFFPFRENFTNRHKCCDAVKQIIFNT